MGIVRNIADKLTNVMSGLGTGVDKNVYNRFSWRILTRDQLENSYRNDWIVRKVVDIVPQDMTREWRSWQASKPQIEKLENEERRLNVRAKVKRAKILARLYGGAAIVMGDGNPMDTPLLPESVGLGGLKFLQVLHRFQITPFDIDRDVLSPTFEQPLTYEVSSEKYGSVKIDQSRVVRFVGAEVPDPATAGTYGWGDSTIQAFYDAVTNAASTQANIASLINEAKLDIIGIPGLMDLIGTAEYEARLSARLAAAATGKSNHNALIMDKDEEWDQRQLSMAGMPEIIRAFLELAAGAADIPLVRLLSVSPSGMNATGAADIRNYYDNIASQQNNDLRPNIEPLDELLIRSAIGKRPSTVWYKFNSLWQLTDAERADIGLKKAQATNIYATFGAMSRQALATAAQNQLIEDGVYPGLEDILQKPDPTDLPNAAIPSAPVASKPNNGPPDKPDPKGDDSTD